MNENAIDRAVGARIAMRRQALGLTQSDLGRGVGVSFQQIQKYERGENRVSASRLYGIAATLRATPADFLPSTSDAEVGEDWLADLRGLTTLPEGRAMALAFPAIADPDVRRCLARMAEALASR